MINNIKQNFPMEEESSKIKRIYPSKKSEKVYPERYNKSVFEQFNKMNKNTELQNNYKKWENGINYATNRKIKIGGKAHRDNKQQFIINFRHDYNETNSTLTSVLFEKLIGINPSDYLKETDKIYNIINTENAIIRAYNASVDNVIEKIKKLEKWDEFIEFEGKKYGLASKVLNNIHVENDCFGEMVYYMEKEKECRGCRDGMPFNGAYTCSCHKYNINKCNKCGFEH
jgi:hypothetical protein